LGYYTWDGIIGKIISIRATIPQKGDEGEDHTVHGGQQGSQTQSPLRSTPTMTPRNYVQSEPSSPADQSLPSYQSSSESDPIIVSLRSRKTKSLR
jgi:hypothetical protein